MRSYMRYGALSAKVRAMYGKRLRFSDFEHMAAMPSEQSVLEYLRVSLADGGGQRLTPPATWAGWSWRRRCANSLWKEYRGLSHLSLRATSSWWRFPSGWPSWRTS